jgi:putative transcriptional regulator
MKPTKKTKTPGHSIISGVKQAIAWAGGEDIPVKKTTIMVPEIDVREVRTRMHLSQDEFAQRFGFAPASVRNWEQGRRASACTPRCHRTPPESCCIGPYCHLGHPAR